MSKYDWSTTASANGNADFASGVNWSEGQAPSSMNDSARAQMAVEAKHLKDNNATLTTGGTGTAYTLTSNGSFSALADGVMLSFIANATCGKSPTLSVNALGAKKLRKFAGPGEVDLAPGDLVANSPYNAVYKTSASGGAGAWIVLNPAIPYALYDLNGLSAFELTFPSWAEGATLTLFNSPGTTNGLLRFSLDGTTYRSGATDYEYGNIATAPSGTATTVISNTSNTFLPVAIASTAASSPGTNTATISRGSASECMSMRGDLMAYTDNTVRYRRYFLYGRTTFTGRAASFQLSSTAGAWGAGSRLKVEFF